LTGSELLCANALTVPRPMAMAAARVLSFMNVSRVKTGWVGRG
jgi:hypothetical protein